MQVASSSLSIPPSPSPSPILSSLRSHPRLSFSISGRVSPSGMGAVPSSISQPASPVLGHVRNPCAGVVHLAESPASSSGPSSPNSLLSFPSAFSALHRLSKTPRSRVVPIIPFPFTPTQDSSVPISVPQPRTRARLVLASDYDHASGTHPDSSDASDWDRMFFFANEDLLPTIYSAGCSTTDHDARTTNISPQQQEDCNAGESLETHTSDTYATNIVESPDSLYGLRRWHALMEIVQTEADYVRDLRKLANASIFVYLPQLTALPLQQHILDSVAELARGAYDILWVHERFMRALQEASTHAGYGASVDEAIERVACLFICEAPSFDLYQFFCSCQPETLRLLRPEQSRPEWKDFEELCARCGDTHVRVDSPDPEAQQVPSSSCRPDTSCPASPKLTSSRTVTFATPSKADSPSPPAPQLINSPMGARSQSYDSLMTASRPSQSGSRLRFQDLLIKPIQRICKYPLMLESLRDKVHGMSADVAVAEAVECMRGVATRVDEARRERDSVEKTKLILERIESHPVVTRAFVESLGVCMLAGSFDVVYHHHISTPAVQPVRIKYVGAFLYPGGYLLLVKSGKGSKGPTYRFKYWFNVGPFDLVDIHEDDAIISHAFRLSYADHHFEISAACETEKDIWTRAINQSRRMQSSCIREPTSSLHLQTSEVPASPTSSENHFSDVMPQPTMPPSPSKVSISEYTRSHSFLRSTTRNRSSISNPGTRLFSVTDGPPPLLKRVPQTERDALDRDLADVLSDLFFSLRSQAQMRDEVIFPPPKFTHPPQTMAIAATGKLVRRGSQIITHISRSSIVNLDLDDETVRQLPPSVRHKPAARIRGPALLPLVSSRPKDTEGEDGSAAQVVYREQCLQPSDVTRTSISEESEHHDASHVSSIFNHPDNSQSHRRTSSLVGSFKGLVRRVTNKRYSLQQVPDTPRTFVDASPNLSQPCDKSVFSRRRASSLPPSPPASSLLTILPPDSGIEPPSTQVTHDMTRQALPASVTPSQDFSGEKTAKPAPSGSIITLNSRRSIRKMLCR
ncbi:hypothetical protein BU17DRAFT_84641 [Hysterangium stoloniferum]|nr:hypothetical protein BU17DRAFT_84641 [Hysterangium stoloniferum]